MRYRLAIAVFLCALTAAGGATAEPPIRLHPRNPRYFEYRGRTTVLVTSAEHYGAVINDDFDQIRYLNTLAADSLNYTRIFVGTYVEKAGAFDIQRNTLAPAAGKFVAPWARSATPGYAGGGPKFDLETWDPAFFERLKGFVREAGQRGIVVEVTLFSSQYNDDTWKLSPLHFANNVNATSPVARDKVHTRDNGNLLGHQERLVRRLVRELNEFGNVIFEIQNEPWSDRKVTTGVLNPYLKAPARDKWPNAIDLADEASQAWQADIAGFITDEERTLGNKHLVAQNVANFRTSVRKLPPGVSIVNVHYALPEAVTWNHGLGLPISYDESGFLDADDATYRREAWTFMLAGGAVFNNLDYSFSIGREGGDDVVAHGPGGGSPAFRKQLKVLRQFMEALPLVDMAPAHHLVRRAPGVVTTALAATGRAYAVYVSGAGPGELDLEMPRGAYEARWIEPSSGRVLAEQPFRHAGGARRLISPAFTGEAVLHVVRARGR